MDSCLSVMSAAIEEFVREQRALLDRLEAFSRSDAYRQLHSSVHGLASAPVEGWLASWLIQEAAAFGGCPLDLIEQPGGLEQVIKAIERSAAGICA